MSGDGTGRPKVPLPVGHHSHLDVDPSGGGERLVDVPQRAGAAGPREVEAGGRLPFGHVAGPVHPDEGERDAAQPRALEGAQAVAERLVADPEPVGEALDVVAGLLGCRVEDAVREDQGGGEVVGDADPDPAPTWPAG